MYFTSGPAGDMEIFLSSTLFKVKMATDSDTFPEASTARIETGISFPKSAQNAVVLLIVTSLIPQLSLAEEMKSSGLSVKLPTVTSKSALKFLGINTGLRLSLIQTFIDSTHS